MPLRCIFHFMSWCLFVCVCACVRARRQNTRLNECAFFPLLPSLSDTRTLFRHLAINAKRFRTTTLGWNTHHRGECIAAHWLCECHSLTRCLCVFALEIFKFLLKGMYVFTCDAAAHSRTHTYNQAGECTVINCELPKLWDESIDETNKKLRKKEEWW